MADEEEVDDSASSEEEEVIEELNGWMVLDHDPEYNLHPPGLFFYHISILI